MQALGRILPKKIAAVADKATVAPEAASPAAAQLRTAIGGHLFGDIDRIARMLHGRQQAPGHAPAEGALTPEALTAQADDLDVDVTFETRRLSSLKATEFPCVALLKDGATRLILGRPDPGRFICDIDGRRVAVERDALEAEHGGTVFFVRSKLAQRGDQINVEKEVETALATGHDIFKAVVRYIFRHHRALLLQLTIATVISNLLMMAVPLFTMVTYDRVIPHLAMETLWALAIGVSIALCVDAAVRFVKLKLFDAISLTTSLDLQARLYRRLLHIRMAEAPRVAGGLASNLRDVEAICTTVPQLFVALTVEAPFFVLMMVLLSSISGWTVIAPVVGLTALLVIHFVGHHSAEQANKEAARLGQLQSNVIIETVGALETVKLTTSEQRLLGKWEEMGDATSFLAHRARLWTQFASQSSMVVAQIVIVMTVVIGVYEISMGAMTVGALAASTMIVGRTISPMANLIHLVERMSQLRQTMMHVAALLKAKEETGGDSGRWIDREVEGQVDFKDVTFAYPGEAQASLSELTLSVQPGERVALIGRIGCGKSTMLRLMTRLHEPTAGTVLIDGYDVRQISPRTLRRAFGYMRQDPVLFDDTLRANIIFGLEDVSEAEFERAVSISGVRDFAARNANGYSLRVGPRGERLSGGERQAVALARALLGDPRVVVLDEPTAAMDSTLEARVIRDLRQWLEGRTLIVATHRAPVLALVDRVIWVDNGRIIADGPRDEVLRKLAKPAA